MNIKHLILSLIGLCLLNCSTPSQQPCATTSTCDASVQQDTTTNLDINVQEIKYDDTAKTEDPCLPWKWVEDSGLWTCYGFGENNEDIYCPFKLETVMWYDNPKCMARCIHKWGRGWIIGTERDQVQFSEDHKKMIYYFIKGSESPLFTMDLCTR